MKQDKISELEGIIAELRAEIILLKEENARLRQELYGRKSEKSKKEKSDAKDPDAQRKANDLMREARKILREADAGLKEEVSREKSTIPIETARHRVPQGIFCGSCGGEVKDQGLAHRADEVDVVSKLFLNREHLLHRGACRCGEVNFVMPGPERGLEKTIYSPRFIAKLIADKFGYHFPIHRQERYLADHGLHIHRQVLNDMILRASRQFEPIVKRIWDLNQKESVQQCDESPVCVVLEQSKDFFLWCLLSPKAITFQMTERRNQEEAARILGPADLTMTDGHCAYRGKAVKGTHGMCLAHARRMFVRSILSFPAESMEAINLFKDIYAVEKIARIDRLDPDGRLALRKTITVPLLDKLWETVQMYNPPPRSSLGKAIKYLIKHWQKLTAFTQDGRLPVDNNAVEREFKEVKLGVKNFLFAQSEMGCEALAGFYTLIATLKLHQKPLMDYLTDVMIKLESGWPNSRLDELLPWNWQAASREVEETLTYREHIVSPEQVIARRKLEGKVFLKTAMPAAATAPPA